MVNLLIDRTERIAILDDLSGGYIIRSIERIDKEPVNLLIKYLRMI